MNTRYQNNNYYNYPITAKQLLVTWQANYKIYRSTYSGKKGVIFFLKHLYEYKVSEY